VDDEDIKALGSVQGEPSVVLIGDSARAESLGLQAVPEEPTEGELAIGVARALEARSLTSENQALRDELDGRFSFGKIVTRDASLKSLLRVLESVAETRATVLILGETGTGKSLLARTLHQASDRRHGPYVEVNCGALPAGLLEAELFGHAKGSFTGATGDRPGRFEAADGGTIFLDEIDSAPLDLQVKLLRVVQDRLFERVGESKTRSSDVRIVAATNASLTARVADGSFREDLYWRLKVVEVSVPPLRERPSDIAPLAEAFVERFAVEYGKAVRGLTPAALGVLARGMWPGNVRQLEHALERAVLLAAQPDGVRPNAIRKLAAGDLESLDAGGAPGPAPRPAMPYRPAGDVPTYPSGPAPPPSFTPEVTLQRGLDWLEKLTGGELSLKAALEGPERMLIEGALRRHTGRRDLAAKELEINRSTLFNKMRKYDLLHMDFSAPASSAGTPTIQPDATSRAAESSGASRAPFSGVNAARTTASSTGHTPGQAQ
jgi:transcriptional regulator with PAS, ATPase and Fis domain